MKGKNMISLNGICTRKKNAKKSWTTKKVSSLIIHD